MKHPALTRIFSLILAVLCLTMLGAGFGLIRNAIRTRASEQAGYQRLSDRVEEYREVHDALSGSKSYEETNAALQKEQDQHQKDASQHKIDLAFYTATRSGLQTGLAALDEADRAFWYGKYKYEQGLALFEEQEKAFWEGYEQFQQGKKQLEAGRNTVALADAALGGLRAQLDQGRSLAAILESDDENARQEITVAAYDSMLQALDGAIEIKETLIEQDGISPEQVQLLAQLLAEQSDVDISEFLDGVSWQGISGDSLRELEEQIQSSTGMSAEEIRAGIQQARDEAAGMDAESPITEEQFAAMQAAYAANRALLEQVDAAMETKLTEWEVQLGETKAQLDEAQKQIDTLEPVMEQGKSAIEQARAALDMAAGQMLAGEQALVDGRRELEAKFAELKEKEETLRREKENLDRKAAELEEKRAAAQALQEMERRETSLRLMLLERDEIWERTERGMELLEAADDYTALLSRQIREHFSDLLWIGCLLIFGGVVGFLQIPSAFEKNKSRFWLVAPVILCLGCAVAAELLCRMQGRGDSYSALGAAIFALIQLALVIPRKKTKA